MLSVLSEKMAPYGILMDEICGRFPHLNKDEWLEDAMPQLRENMSEDEMLQILIQAAVEKTSVEEPDWQFAAAHLLAHCLYKEAAENRNYEASRKYGDLYTLIHTLTEKGLYGKYLLEHYSKAEIEELEAYL